MITARTGRTSDHTKQAIALLKDAVKAQGWRYPLFLLLILALTATSLLPPRLFILYTSKLAALGNLTDAGALDFLHALIFFGLCIAVIMLFAGSVSVVAEEWICLRIEANLRHRALYAIHAMDMDELDTAQRGDWLTRMSGDLRCVEQFLSMTAPGHLQSALTLLAVTILLAMHSAALAIGLLLSAASLALINVIVQRHTLPELDRIRELHGNILQSLLENFEGIASIRSLGAEAQMRAWFGERVNHIMRSSMQVIRTIGVLVGGNSSTTNILTTFCLAGTAWYFMRGALSVEEALVVPFYIGMFYHAALSFTGAAIDWSRFVANAGRLADLLSQPEASRCQPHLDQLPLVLTRGVIRLTSVKVAVQGRPPLTRTFNLTLRMGQMLIVQGPSGCGKSTFLQMLAGLRPFSQGGLTIYDNALERQVLTMSHLPMARAESHLWIPRELCTYVEQRPFLFESSIRDNLILGMAQEPNDADLWRALFSVQLNDLIESRGGLDAGLADHGKNLSEGQKYRLALARALLRSRPFILLDEPFSALDELSAATVCRALELIRPKCGLIIVSHIIPREITNYDLLDFALLAPRSSAQVAQMVTEQSRSRSESIVI